MLRYRLEGSGQPLLLIHGWGVTYAIWQNLAPLLRPHFQLIMIELPGVGGSPAADAHLPYYQVCAEAIEEVRQELGIEQWAVLAYSSGTRAAEAYVKRYPQSITHAIFLCPTYILEIWALFVRLLATPHPSMLTQWVFSDWRLHSLVRAFGFNGRRHDYTYVWTNEIALQPLNSLVRSLCEMPGRGRTPFYVPSMPTLFIWGGRDALIAPPRQFGPHDALIPTADHSAPMLEAPAVAEIVIPFIRDGRNTFPSVPIRRRWRSTGLPLNSSKASLRIAEQRRTSNLFNKRRPGGFSLRRKTLQRMKRQ